jgi:hypothetical protein
VTDPEVPLRNRTNSNNIRTETGKKENGGGLKKDELENTERKAG